MAAHTPRKTYVLDSSAYMYDPRHCIDVLADRDNEVIVPGPALQELTNHEHGRDPRKRYLARQANETLERYRKRGTLASPDGIRTERGGIVRIEMRSLNAKRLPIGLDPHDPDNQIILVGMFVAESIKKLPQQNRRPVILVSKDMSMRQRAEGCGLDAQDYQSGRVEDFNTTIYGSVQTIDLPDDAAPLLRGLYTNRELPLSELRHAVGDSPVDRLFANQCVILKLPNGKTALGIFKQRDGVIRSVKPVKDYDPQRDAVVPRNDMQAFGRALLDDHNIGIVTLVGIAGAGKTLLALDWAYNSILGNGGGFERIIIFRSNVEAGFKIGSLPGDIGDKFGPWREPIYRTIDFITRRRQRNKGDDDPLQRRARQRGDGIGHGKRNSIADELEERGQLVIMPPNFSRGATYHNAIVIIDDAQNLEVELLNLLITRVGEPGRVIVNGDPTQIDNPHLVAEDCGLVRAVRAFQGEELCASVYLPRSERSEIAELAATRLGANGHDDW